jgi:hypothetical protein
VRGHTVFPRGAQMLRGVEVASVGGAYAARAFAAGGAFYASV